MRTRRCCDFESASMTLQQRPIETIIIFKFTRFCHHKVFFITTTGVPLDFLTEKNPGYYILVILQKHVKYLNTNTTLIIYHTRTTNIHAHYFTKPAKQTQKHLYDIYTTSAQLLQRWTNIV